MTPVNTVAMHSLDLSVQADPQSHTKTLVIRYTRGCLHIPDWLSWGKELRVCIVKAVVVCSNLDQDKTISITVQGNLPIRPNSLSKFQCNLTG